MFLMPGAAFAEGVVDSGDTSWLLTATALVLFMTIPGLSFFMQDWFGVKMFYQY